LSITRTQRFVTPSLICAFRHARCKELWAFTKPILSRILRPS
jgi:hypothetical protein